MQIPPFCFFFGPSTHGSLWLHTTGSGSSSPICWVLALCEQILPATQTWGPCQRLSNKFATEIMHCLRGSRVA